MTTRRQPLADTDRYGTVIKNLDPLRETADGDRLDVRVLETRRGRVLDVREFVDEIASHTRRGVRLSSSEFAALLAHADEITALLDGADAPASELAAESAVASTNGATR